MPPHPILPSPSLRITASSASSTNQGLLAVPKAGVVDEQQSQAGAVVNPEVFYMKQTISNACGTIGVLHAIGNNLEAAGLREPSFFTEFFQATAGMSMEERGAYLEAPPQDAPSIDEAHLEAAMEGDTEPELDVDVTPHFVALVNHKGRLLELDGRKNFPVDHGPTSQEDLLKDAAAVARKFMDKIDSINFNLIALAAPAQ